MSVERAIICDGCARLLAAARTAGIARREVAEMGGRVGLPGGKDLCADCAAASSPVTPGEEE